MSPIIPAGEAGNCPKCSARLQHNLDGAVIHARAGSVECPPIPFEEPYGLLLILQSASPRVQNLN